MYSSVNEIYIKILISLRIEVGFYEVSKTQFNLHTRKYPKTQMSMHNLWTKIK